jgi:hypothetical protein
LGQDNAESLFPRPHARERTQDLAEAVRAERPPSLVHPRRGLRRVPEVQEGCAYRL